MTEVTDKVTNKQFRFYNAMGMLTYSTHLPKEEYIEWFEEQFGDIEFIRLGHEIGGDDEEEGYEHTHVVFKTCKAIQTKNQRRFDYKEIHPHILTVKTKADFNRLKGYISKQDPENKDLEQYREREKITIIDKLGKSKNINEALNNNAKKWSDVGGIIQAFNCINKNTLTRWNWIPEKQWQLDLIEKIKLPPHPREITWIYNRTGNNGKTSLAKWLTVNYPNDWLITKDMGTSRDAATIIQSALNSGWNSWGCIVDLPRSAESHERMYVYLEEIKDGFITSQKYQGRTMVFDNPHLIVFANWRPNTDKLSYDRWNIIKIDDGASP